MYVGISSLFSVEEFVHDGDDEDVEQRRCEQSGKDDLCHGALDFVAREVAS
jgi:hypothetical protein